MGGVATHSAPAQGADHVPSPKVGVAMHRGGGGWTREQNKKAMATFDEDGDGQVTLEEFLGFYGRSEVMHVTDAQFEAGMRRFLAAAAACAKKHVEKLEHKVQVLKEEKIVLVKEAASKDFSEEVAALKEQVESLQNKLNFAQSYSADCEKMYVEVKVSREALDRQVEALQKDQEQSRQEWERKEEKLWKRIQAAEAEVKTLENSVKNSREAFESLQRDNEDLKAELERQQAAVDADEKKYAASIAELKDAVGSEAAAVKVHEAQLKEAQRAQVGASHRPFEGPLCV